MDTQEAAVALLDAHDGAGDTNGRTEHDVRACICSLLEASGLVAREEMRLEKRVGKGFVDIHTSRVVFEVKKRVGSRGGGVPDSEYVDQLDQYLRDSIDKGSPHKLGVPTDGRHWIARPPSHVGGEVLLEPPYVFTLQDAELVGDWIDWLDGQQILYVSERMPSSVELGEAFGASIVAKDMVERLRSLYDDHSSKPTVQVKRSLWQDLLGAALGEAVDAESDLDGLFVRHTYLSTIVALALQQEYDIDIRAISRIDAPSLVDGTEFAHEVGIRGVVDSDFFGWTAEVEGGTQWIQELADWVAGFNWSSADYDTGRTLYQGVITADERARLGEYYTPDWLAAAIVSETVDDPLNQKVLDPSCGSGTFLRAAIVAHIEAARAEGRNDNTILTSLRSSVIGIDIHPVAVYLARATWVRAAREVIVAADTDDRVGAVPVYLGDSLQLRAHTNATGDLFGSGDTVVIEAETMTKPVSLSFPRTLVSDGDLFDKLILRATANIKADIDPLTGIDTSQRLSPDERSTLEKTLETMRSLHEQGRNHVWGYYVRNLVRPIWLSNDDDSKVDRIIGNPPWLTYNQTRSSLRTALEQLAKKYYKIWPQPHYVTHADVASLFYTRCFDLYLKRREGRQAMVMPHSALAAGQYAKWHLGAWGDTTSDLSDNPWDLENLEPNNFFPVPSSVIFAKTSDQSVRLANECQIWTGTPGGPFTRHLVAIPGAMGGGSPYHERAKQGATIVPRCLFFVNIDTSPSTTRMERGVSSVSPARTSQEKTPWVSLELPQLQNRPILDSYIRQVRRGDTIAPYLLLEPAHAVLPWPTDGEPQWGLDHNKPKPQLRVYREQIEERMLKRWDTIEQIWETYKRPNNNHSLIEWIDYRGKLSAQNTTTPIRLIYASAGRPTAAVLKEPNSLIESKLFAISCTSLAEADYLAAIINSISLYDAVSPLMPKGQWGPRDLQKHLWRLPIPTYDPQNRLHRQLAQAGRQAEERIADIWRQEHQKRIEEQHSTGVTAARKHIRKWLTTNEFGLHIDKLAQNLLSNP